MKGFSLPGREAIAGVVVAWGGGGSRDREEGCGGEIQAGDKPTKLADRLGV